MAVTLIPMALHYTVIFSNTVILFMEGIPFSIFQYRPALVVMRCSKLTAFLTHILAIYKPELGTSA